MLAAPQDLFFDCPIEASPLAEDPSRSCPDCAHYKRLADGASCRARYWYVALPQGVEAHPSDCQFFDRKEQKNG